MRASLKPLLDGLLLAAALTGCGGSGGQGSGLVFPAASPPTGEASAGSSTSSALSLAQQIEALERKGAYPALDRSSDIAGPDVNQNGVRDDIEAWINAQPVTEPQRKALMQKARTLQRTLLIDLGDKSELEASGARIAASSRCGLIQFPDYLDFSKLAGRIEAMTANTKERAQRYMQYNAARSGSSTTSPRGDTCEP